MENDHIITIDEERWTEVSMSESAEFRMPSCTNQLESTHGHLNSAIPRRNKCFPSFRRVTRKVLMSCKMEWVLNVTIVMVRNHDILTTTPYGSIC
ncbi:hypothetical protein M9Y10_013614 [Tritrichomonas musculus]|uniref:Uncharacterized protein n=1 Tax=Tritrichomonas musculus TaxID=1915356 RepID=A0ABR2L0E7_9EUKA